MKVTCIKEHEHNIHLSPCRQVTKHFRSGFFLLRLCLINASDPLDFYQQPSESTVAAFVPFRVDTRPARGRILSMRQGELEIKTMGKPIVGAEGRERWQPGRRPGHHRRAGGDRWKTI